MGIRSATIVISRKGYYSSFERANHGFALPSRRKMLSLLQSIASPLQSPEEDENRDLTMFSPDARIIHHRPEPHFPFRHSSCPLPVGCLWG